MQKVRIAVVGVGNMGQHHARIYSEMEHVELVGVVDVHEAKGKHLADRFKTTYFSDYRTLLGAVKGVNIVVPTSLHYPMAMEFLANNVHVLVEKPITTDIARAKEIVELAKMRNLIVQVGHLERFNPAVLDLKKRVKKPCYVEAHRLSYPTARNLDVGVVWDLMIHDLDILLNLIQSPVVKINALGMSIYSTHEDLALVQLLFKNGCIASLRASRVSGERRRELRVIEQDRTYHLDFINQTLAILRPPHGNKTNPPEYVPIKKQEPLRLELEHFAECVAMNKTPLVTGEDGKKALELAIQVVGSMHIVKYRRGALAKKLLAMAA